MTRHRLYAGTYTQSADHVPNATGKGIYWLDFDAQTGLLEEPTLAAPIENPSWVQVHPAGSVLLSVSETGEGSVHSFQIKEDGSLRLLSAQTALGGATANVSTDLQGKHAFAANYIGEESVLGYDLSEAGQLSPHFGLDRHKGKGPVEDRQDAPHAHCIRPSPDGRYMHATNLGSDEIYTYDLQAEAGPLTRVRTTSLPAGSGPRHICFHPEGKLAFVSLELSSQVASLSLEPETGTLLVLSVHSTLPDDFTEKNTPAEILTSKDGRFLYVSNRGHDSVTSYRVDARTGELELLEIVPVLGKTPRGFVFSPDEKFLLVANQDSDSITVLSRDLDTGKLEVGGTFPCPTPTSLSFVPR